MLKSMLDSAKKGRFGVLFLELFVLVTGILIALGIDEWRQERDDRFVEREYLLAIRADLASDLQGLDERIFPEIEMRIEKSAQLRAYTPDNVPETLEAQREFVRDISMSGFMNTFQPRRNAMDDLLATGNLRLISNTSLRLELLNFYSTTQKWEPYDEWARELIWKNYRNEFTGFIPLDAVYMSEEGRDPAPRESFIAIVESEVFQRGLLNVRFMANWQNGVYEQVRESIEELMTAVDAELERLLHVS